MTGNKQHHENQITTSSHRRAQEQVVISGRFGVEVTSGRQKIWSEQVGAGRVASRGCWVQAKGVTGSWEYPHPPYEDLTGNEKLSRVYAEQRSVEEKREEMVVIFSLWKLVSMGSSSRKGQKITSHQRHQHIWKLHLPY